MSVGLPGLVWAVVSAAGIAILAATDPKRRRMIQSATRSAARLLLLLGILTPGVALGVAGRWSDFLIWIGATAVFGWAIAALSNVWSKSRMDRSQRPG
jgi:hypothetical protein